MQWVFTQAQARAQQYGIQVRAVQTGGRGGPAHGRGAELEFRCLRWAAAWLLPAAAGRHAAADAGRGQEHHPGHRVDQCHCQRRVRARDVQDHHHGQPRAQQLPHVSVATHDPDTSSRGRPRPCCFASARLAHSCAASPSCPRSHRRECVGKRSPCGQGVAVSHACFASVRRYMGSQGIYTHTVQNEKDPGCPICSPGVPLTVAPDQTLQQVRAWWGAALAAFRGGGGMAPPHARLPLVRGCHAVPSSAHASSTTRGAHVAPWTN